MLDRDLPIAGSTATTRPAARGTVSAGARLARSLAGTASRTTTAAHTPLPKAAEASIRHDTMAT
jgi:hypothetical protein